MTREDIYDAVSGVDPDLLTEAETYHKRSSGKRIWYDLAIAAGVIVMAGTVWFGLRLLMPKEEPQDPTLTDGAEIAENEAVTAGSSEEKRNGAETAEHTAESPAESRKETETAEPIRAVSLSCFRVGEKAEALDVLQQEFASFVAAEKAGTLEEFAEKYPETAEAFSVYWPYMTSENRFNEAQLFYVWLFPEQYEKTGVDTLLIGVRTRFQIPEKRDSLNTGETVENPDYASGKKTDWIYSFGFFYLYDSNTGECTRMDPLRQGAATTIRLLNDKTVNISEQPTTIDENNPEIVWSTQMEKIISFDETGYPVLEENLPVLKYANPAEGADGSSGLDRDAFEALYPMEAYEDNWALLDEAIVAHGGIYDDSYLEKDPSLDFGILYSDDQ